MIPSLWAISEAGIILIGVAYPTCAIRARDTSNSPVSFVCLCPVVNEGLKMGGMEPKESSYMRMPGLLGQKLKSFVGDQIYC